MSHFQGIQPLAGCTLVIFIADSLFSSLFFAGCLFLTFSVTAAFQVPKHFRCSMIENVLEFIVEIMLGFSLSPTSLSALSCLGDMVSSSCLKISSLFQSFFFAFHFAYVTVVRPLLGRFNLQIYFWLIWDFPVLINIFNIFSDFSQRKYSNRQKPLFLKFLSKALYFIVSFSHQVKKLTPII